MATDYVTNITDPGIPFTGVIEMTALVDPASFGGRSLVYLPRYLAQDDPTWKRSDDDLVAETVATLARMYPQFRQSDVLASRVARVREVHAISTIDYSRSLLPSLQTSIANVFVVNSAQIAYGTLNVNETLALAARQAEALAPLIGPAAGSSPRGQTGSALPPSGRTAAVPRARHRPRGPDCRIVLVDPPRLVLGLHPFTVPVFARTPWPSSPRSSL